MNPLYASLLRSRIAAAVAEAKTIQPVEHNGLRGALREMVVRQLLHPLLPPDVGIGTGVVISAAGQQSKQTDIILYDKNLIPPLLLADQGLFPIESVLVSIEVKSILTQSELLVAHRAAELLNTFTILPGLYTEAGEPIQHTQISPPSALIAFGSDLTASTELERYQRLLVGSQQELGVICVVSRQCVVWNSTKWLVHPASEDHDELVAFLAVILNTLPGIALTRGRPRMGKYLT